MKLWSILGNSQKLDGGAMFGNAPKAMWERWTSVDAGNRIDLACRALLASPLNGKTVLFETGIGAFFESKLRERYGVQEARHVLLDSLGEAGFGHEDIDVVVLSHLHFDHAGGLLAAWEEGQPARLLFPNATYVVGAQHWQRALCPHPRDRASFIPELPGLLQASAGWKSWMAISRRRWATACASTTATATRRACCWRRSSVPRPSMGSRMAAWCSAPT